MDRMLIPFREIKFASDDSMEFSGYGAVFGNVDAYGDVILPGAFADTLAASQKSGIWPSMLSQHGGWGITAEDLTPVGVWAELAEDGHGLKSHGVLAPIRRAQDLRALMKMAPRPAIDGLSIGYIPKEFSMRSKPEEPRRTLKKVDLIEISLVTFPANGKARITSVKSLDEIVTMSDAEAFLREVGGFSKSHAVGLIARIKAAAASGRSESDEPVMDPDEAQALKASFDRFYASLRA